jgi:hypothetical protein
MQINEEEDDDIIVDINPAASGSDPSPYQVSPLHAIRTFSPPPLSPSLPVAVPISISSTATDVLYLTSDTHLLWSMLPQSNYQKRYQQFPKKSWEKQPPKGAPILAGV